MRNLLVRLRSFGKINSFGLLVAVAVGAVCLGAGFWNPATHSAAGQILVQLNKGIQIDNKTQSIEVVRAERKEGSVQISLKNTSNKSIDGLQVRVGSVAIQTEFLGSGVTFAPGSVHEETYVAQQALEGPVATILCVIFEDGSSEGDHKFVKQIVDKRLGESIQTRRALLLIDQALARSEVNSETLETLKREISSLPIRENDTDNNDRVLGLQDGKARLINQLEGVSRKHALTSVSVSQELVTLKQSLNRSIKQ